MNLEEHELPWGIVMNIEKMLVHEIELWGTMHIPALMQRFVKKHGRVMTPAPLPVDVVRGPAKACFSNAFELALQNKKLGYRYVEGYAVPSIRVAMLFHHAWVIDENDRVVDNTWDDPTLCQYYGVEISMEDVLTQQINTRGYSVLDSGSGVNTSFIFEKDPELEVEFNGIVARRQYEC